MTFYFTCFNLKDMSIKTNSYCIKKDKFLFRVNLLILLFLLPFSVLGIDCDTLFNKMRFTIYNVTFLDDNGFNYYVYVQGYANSSDDRYITIYRIGSEWRPTININKSYLLPDYIDSYRLVATAKNACHLETENNSVTDEFKNFHIISYVENFDDLRELHLQKTHSAELIEDGEDHLFFRHIYNADLLLAK